MTETQINVAGMPEFDAMLDHIYEYGTASEGIIDRANAFARALLARHGQPAASAEPRVVDMEEYRAVVAAMEQIDPATLPGITTAQPAAPAAQALQQEADPCPQCIPGGVCKTPTCGRLLAAQAQSDDARDAARYRWLRVRWGRIADTYDGDSDRLVEIREADDRFEGWDVSPESLDAVIDAAMRKEGK